MNKSELPRGDCPVCGRPTVLLKDGRVGRHADQTTPRRAWPPTNCAGWGEMPKATGDA